MGVIKDRNDKNLTEAGEIKKRQQEYTAKLYRKGLNEPNNYGGVVTHLEPDIQEGEVKGSSGSDTTNEASGGDSIPAELFKILKMMQLKCFTQCVSKFGKLSSGHRSGKDQFFLPVPKKGSAKGCSNYHTAVLISHASKA